MRIDIREIVLQLKALARLCIFHPNSWREVTMGAIAVLFAPLVVLICVLANTRYRRK